MIKKNKIVILVIIFVVYLISSFIFLNLKKNNNLDNWLGSYNYTAIFPHGTDKDMNYVIDYNILIYKEEGNYYAKIINDGWFTQTRSLAQIIGNKYSIDIKFLETLPEDSLYGEVERYERNEILLNLNYNESELQTLWLALRSEHPTFAENNDSITGIYFKKIE